MEVRKRPIRGYEGIYEAGEDGEIYSIGRFCACGPDGTGKRWVRSRKLKKNIQHGKDGGYQVRVSLYKDKKIASLKVNHLIAEAWLGWKEGMVLLADGDHMNTSVENLRPIDKE